MKRITALILLLCMLAACVASCKPADVTGESSETSADNNRQECNVGITLGGENFIATVMNSLPNEGEIAIFTHEYRNENGYVFQLDGDYNEYAAITIRYIVRGEQQEAYLFEVDDTSDSKSGKIIPYNGFIALVPRAALEGLRVKTSQLTTITGYDTVLEYENIDLSTLMPENKSLTRRINYSNPFGEFPTGDNIVLIDENYDEFTIPSGAAAVLLERISSSSARVIEVRISGKVAKEEVALIFSGDYNLAFAQRFFAPEDRVTISGTASLSQYSDVSALVIPGETPKVFRVGEARTNCAATADSGVYFYDNKFTASATPAHTADFVNVVVIDNMIAYIGNKNERIMIPASNGLVASFVGDKISEAEQLSLGQAVETVLVDIESLPAKYVRVGEYVFEVTGINELRDSEGDVILYDASYGSSTLSNEYGTEIIIVDGAVASVETGAGDAKIPENGYVLSLHKDCKNYSNASSVEQGDGVAISVVNTGYSVYAFDITAFDAVRYTDYLVVYTKPGRTGTNVYGYELTVDANNKITGVALGGNAAVPNGGYVLSGHGKAEEALRLAYVAGADVKLDREAKKVYIITNPLLTCSAAESLLASTKAQLESARAVFYDIDYQGIGAELDEISNVLQRAATAKQESNFSEAVNLAASASDRINKLSYSMVTSRVSENRAAWYRATEKNDAEVKATLEKASSLNLNALYVETWYNGRTIGFSEIEGIKHNTTHGDYDVLEGFCRLAKEYGIEIHAWVENFFVGTVEDAAVTPDALINILPQSKRLLDSEGNDFYVCGYGSFVFLNPYERANRELVLSVYKELIQKYDIDGIHLDYIRFPEHNYGKNDYGYNDDIIAAFKAETGFKGNVKALAAGTTMYDRWVAFRCNIIDTFVKEVFDLVVAEKPELWISCAAYPAIDSVPSYIYQDVKKWVANGWIDEVFSMTYSNDNSYVYTNAKQFVTAINGKSFYTTGLSGFGDTPADTFALQFEEARKAGATGSAVFSLASVDSEAWLKKFDSYSYAMVGAAYARKSVQTYLLNKTLAVEIEEHFRRVDELYGDAYAFNSVLKQRLTALLNKCKSFDYDGSTIKQKSDFAGEALAELGELRTALKSFEYTADKLTDACKKAVDTELALMESHLSILKSRLDSRLK